MNTINFNSNPNFNYWKSSYQKNLLKLAFILSLLTLSLNFYEFYRIASPEIRMELFTQSQWAEYSYYKYFQFAQRLMYLFLIATSFLTAHFAKTQKIAHHFDALYMIGASFYWCVIWLILGSQLQIIDFIFWLVILALMLCFGINSLQKSRKLQI